MPREKKPNTNQPTNRTPKVPGEGGEAPAAPRGRAAGPGGSGSTRVCISTTAAKRGPECPRYSRARFKCLHRNRSGSGRPAATARGERPPRRPPVPRVPPQTPPRVQAAPSRRWERGLGQAKPRARGTRRRRGRGRRCRLLVKVTNSSGSAGSRREEAALNSWPPPAALAGLPSLVLL